MKVYISSHCIHAARHVASELCFLHEIVSRWHDGSRPMGRSRDKSHEQKQKIAIENIDEVSQADVLVLISAPGMTPGGKFIEAGVAIGNDIPVIVLGERENLMLFHPMVHVAETVFEVRGLLAKFSGSDLEPEDLLMVEATQADLS